MSQQYVTVRTLNSLQDAYIIKGMLADNGIPSMITNENNLYTPVFDGVRVSVRQCDEERALELLKEFDD